MEEKLGDRILQFSSVWVTKTTDCVNNKKNLSGIWKMDFFSLFFLFFFYTEANDRRRTSWHSLNLSVICFCFFQ